MGSAVGRRLLVLGMNAPVLFVAAEPRECGPWVAKWTDVRDAHLPVHWSRTGKYHGVEMMAVANGAGAERARTGVLAAPHPRAVCSIGYCGALDPSLRIADIFVATEIVAGDRHRRVHALTLPQATTGAIASVSTIAHTALRKRELRALGAEAVEMEAAGAFDAAAQLGVPFYCIRAVSDLANEDFAVDLNRFLMPNGRFNVLRLVLHACLNPVKRFGELLRLNRRTTLASENLGEFLARCSF